MVGGGKRCAVPRLGVRIAWFWPTGELEIFLDRSILPILLLGDAFLSVGEGDLWYAS